jgi:hypothetical protein
MSISPNDERSSALGSGGTGSLTGRVDKGFEIELDGWPDVGLQHDTDLIESGVILL